MKLSKNFDHTEFLSPDIEVIPKQAVENLKLLCQYVLQPLREYLGSPVKINSGYRTKWHNKKVGGYKTSDHLKGMAADITTTDNRKAFDWIAANCQFKQLIDEKNYRWIHVSYDKNNLKTQILHL